MSETQKASRRRRRALAVVEQKPAVQQPRPRRRKITSRARAEFRKPEASMWKLEAKPGYMGQVLDQPFYSSRYMPAGALDLPFEDSAPFACMINATVHIGDEAFRELAQKLLSRGMIYALCTGVESERLCDILNDLLEGGEHYVAGQTPMGIAYEEEPIEEVMEFFALPSGIAPANLLLTIGEERMQSTQLRTFQRVVSHMRDALSA